MAIKKVNLNLVTQFLALSPHSTCEEIMAATKLSKATVHRVIAAVPAIYKSDQYKSAPTYYVDIDEFQDGIAAGLSVAPQPIVPVGVHPKVTEYLNKLQGLPLSEQIEEIKLALTKVSDGLDDLLKTEHYSHLYQSGQGELPVVHWSKTQEKLAGHLLFVETLAQYYKFYLNDPRSKTPEFWSIFPKD